MDQQRENLQSQPPMNPVNGAPSLPERSTSNLDAGTSTTSFHPFQRFRSQAKTNRFLSRRIQMISPSQNELLESHDKWQPPLVGRPMRPGTVPVELLNIITLAADSSEGTFPKAFSYSQEISCKDSLSVSPQVIAEPVDGTDPQYDLPRYPVTSSASFSPSADAAKIEDDLNEEESVEWSSSPPLRAECVPPDSSPPGPQRAPAALPSDSETFAISNSTGMVATANVTSVPNDTGTSSLTVIDLDMTLLTGPDGHHTSRDEANNNAISRSESKFELELGTASGSDPGPAMFEVPSTELNQHPQDGHLNQISPNSDTIKPYLFDVCLSPCQELARLSPAVSLAEPVTKTSPLLFFPTIIPEAFQDPIDEAFVPGAQEVLNPEDEVEHSSDIGSSEIDESGFESSDILELEDLESEDQFGASQQLLSGMLAGKENMSEGGSRNCSGMSEDSNESGQRAVSHLKRKLVETGAPLGQSAKRSKSSQCRSISSSLTDDQDFRLPKSMARMARREFVKAYKIQPGGEALHMASSFVPLQMSQHSAPVNSDQKLRHGRAFSKSGPRYATPASRASALGSSSPSSKPLRRLTLPQEQYDIVHRTFTSFKTSYPHYSGDTAQFSKTCQMIKEMRSDGRTLPKGVWDDFVFRHQHDYRDYLMNINSSSEPGSPMSYDQFYADIVEKPVHLERVVTPSFIDKMHATEGAITKEETPSVLSNLEDRTENYGHNSIAVSSSANKVKPALHYEEAVHSGSQRCSMRTPSNQLCTAAPLSTIFGGAPDAERSPKLWATQDHLGMKNSQQSRHSQSSSVKLWLDKASGAASPELGTPGALEAQEVAPLMLEDNTKGHRSARIGKSKVELPMPALAISTRETVLETPKARNNNATKFKKLARDRPSLVAGQDTRTVQRGERGAVEPDLARVIDIFSWKS